MVLKSRTQRHRQDEPCLPRLRSTRGGAVKRPAPSVHTHEDTCMQGQCQGMECQHHFFLLRTGPP